MLDREAQDEPTRRYRSPREPRLLERPGAFDPPLGEHLHRAPPQLYVAGDVSLLRASLRVSIVGARAASTDGLRRATKLASQLVARGAVVVSGLAEGIDAAAHQGAIAARGRTIAVIGTPLERCYPAKHAALQELIYRDHLLVSQFAPGAKIGASNFPARNRTMAMLSHASVIVEAGDSSGSLSQAAEIQRLGRPLFIMRSVVENSRLSWPAAFLKSGAQILDDVVQIVSALGDGVRTRTGGVQQLPLYEQSRE
ncbi:DNA-processing protein DprA [Nannocystis sp. SCPEA4]|uniref:DNA-processing protein DprA n=1 Tax=Nannocystis sp. SCPEA4 TaxID=2996787 RepID=UPI0022716F7F|nr:DNA-processing protein DprA [Nannocystis sp. SCPEA4]MCY1057508.1 DNA-processing protein DprA [Nannocystis sp. SCPEA4]